MTDTCFRMKGTTLTSIVLEVVSFDPDIFTSQLEHKVATAPQFFKRSSLIIQLNASLSATEFELLVAICKRLALQPMAVRGNVEGLKTTINDLGLADVSQSKFSETSLGNNRSENTQQDEAEGMSTKASAVAATVSQTALKPAKVITRPVRSGQQVYADGCDLIVAATVSEGAEVLADGNIHIYGTLRGRALAGVKGNTHARVFCQSLDAELISIAGQFIMHETVKASCWKMPAHIFLEDDTLRIEPLAQR
ncbi:septum site-determining protein MinC [Alteromonas sp. A079]|uniref:septum site-determining protein MinC n=1 Tax=Alteromonas sp. A079 TaxID=3410268 RepID=UPI003BA07633